MSLKSRIAKIINTLNQNRFLFKQLVKRDFKQKYKRTILGMFWSILNPLLTLLVMRIVFLRMFLQKTPSAFPLRRLILSDCSVQIS